MTTNTANVTTRDTMTDAQFDAMMERGYQQAINGETVPLDEAFEQISKEQE